MIMFWGISTIVVVFIVVVLYTLAIALCQSEITKLQDEKEKLIEEIKELRGN